MQKQLDKLNLDYEIFEAIDGSRLSEEKIRENANLDVYKDNPNWINRGYGTVACAISHHKVYAHMVKNKIPRALILEDDAIVSKDLKEILINLESMNNIDKKELILFYTISINGEFTPTKISSLNQKKIIKKFNLAYPLNTNVWTTTAYSISYESALKFIEVYPKVERVSDAWREFYQKEIFSTIRCIVPFPIKPADFDSTRYRIQKKFNFKAFFYKYNKKRYDFFKKKYLMINEKSILDMDNIQKTSR